MKFDKDKLSMKEINKKNFEFQITFKMNIMDLLYIDSDVIKDIKEFDKIKNIEDVLDVEDIEYYKELKRKLINGISKEEAFDEFLYMLSNIPDSAIEFMVDNKTEKTDIL